jgi:hypothetical protein
MNLYFVFEGKTEAIVYKSWFSKLLPTFTEVDNFESITHQNYYYESDMGVPDCYNVVANAIQDIHEVPKYDYLVLFVDADRHEVEEPYQRIFERLNDPKKGYKYRKLPENCELVILVQKVCIETWFLGNRKFFVRNPQSELLRQYIHYFDVSTQNPEDLAHEFVQTDDGSSQIFGYNTKALFHESYIRELFKERLQGIAYHKHKPREVQQATYLEQLELRTQTSPTHLLSFQEFIRFCEKIRKQLS